MTYKQALEHLNRYRQMDADRWGIFFLGTQVFLGNTRVYASEKTARIRIMSEFKEAIGKPYRPYHYTFGLKSHASELKYQRELKKYNEDMKVYEEKNKKLKESAKKVITDLESTGMLEIRRIGDRSPKFPFNKPNIDKEQAEKFSKMLDASDKEMVNLAITILEKI